MEPFTTAAGMMFGKKLGDILGKLTYARLEAPLKAKREKLGHVLKHV